MWIDFGKDFYASQTWNDAPGGRPVWLAWMNNWQYANEIPTSPWRGAMALPRTVALRKTEDGLRIVQAPVETLKAIRKGIIGRSRPDRFPSGETKLGKEGIAGTSLEIIAEFDRGNADEFGLKVRCGDGEETVIGFDRRAGRCSSIGPDPGS